MTAADLAQLLALPRGVVRVLHLDGRVEDVLGQTSNAALRALLDADTLDFVPVAVSSVTRLPRIVLAVDDRGHAKGLPINTLADAVYQLTSPPQPAPGFVVGPAALVHDAD